MEKTKKKALYLDSINPNIIALEYAVRGPIVQRALDLEKEIKEGCKKPFSEVVKCNIGDCHATGQKPITFLRQVMALLSYPQLLDSSEIPADAKDRARRILSSCSGTSVGSYSLSVGVEVIRKDIASFIHQRDGISSNPANIFLSTGASEAVKVILSLISTTLPGDQRTGVMIPIPQYPLYSATNAEYNAYQIDYYLNEETLWSLSTEELERALASAKGKCVPRAIVVINPGNPTGQVLSKQDMLNVVKFAAKHRLVLLADEVYQFNVYRPAEAPWTSFKRVLHDAGPGFADTVELVSFMSASKGYMGECGYRGGYCEIVNMEPDVQAQLYKCLSARLCSSVMGQAMIGVIANPPRKDEPSYASFCAERDSVLLDLATKAELVNQTLNSLPGVVCQPVLGAMYAFPKLNLPVKAIKAAEAVGQPADFFYCLHLLEEKGICVVPGSGFGQKPGTYHFRTTILPTVEKMRQVMKDIKDFHIAFMEKYKD